MKSTLRERPLEGKAIEKSKNYFVRDPLRRKTK